MPLEKSAAASLCIESATATICCTFGPPPRSGSLQALQTSEKKTVSAPRICACSRAHVTVLFLFSGRGWGVLENSAHINAALSRSEWQVVAGSKQTMCVEAFAYGL